MPAHKTGGERDGDGMYTGIIKTGDGRVVIINGTEPNDLEEHLVSRESREKMKAMIGGIGVGTENEQAYSADVGQACEHEWVHTYWALGEYECIKCKLILRR